MNLQFAVFLDRDGVINREVDNLKRIEDLEILPRVPKAIKLLNNQQIPVIVVTNQPVVARGWLDERGVEKVHQKLEYELEQQGAKITAFYFCPHHPEANLKQYRIKCDCRKPDIGLFTKAAKQFRIDLTLSYMVGDSFRDIEAGKKFGGTTIAVKCGASDFRDSEADFIVKDLYEAVQLILQKENLL